MLRRTSSFAAEFDRTFGAAIPPLIAQLGHAGVRSGRQATVATTVRGAKGTIRVNGVGVTQPRPAHWDITLTFGRFSAPATKGKTPLGVNGALQFNVVTPGRAALGLFRGFLMLSGAFRGSAEVVGEVSGGKVVALVVTSKGQRLTVGRTPRTLVSYVGTVRAGRPGEPTGSAERRGSTRRRGSPSRATAGSTSPTGRTTPSGRSHRPDESRRSSAASSSRPTSVSTARAR